MSWEHIIDGYKINSMCELDDLKSDLNGDFVLLGIKDTATEGTMFLKKLHADGSEIFNLTNPTIFPTSITTDIEGNIFVGGWHNIIPLDYLEILKYDSAGNFKWMVLDQVSTSSNDKIQMSCDSLGNVYFGVNYLSGSAPKILMGKIDANGNLIRSNTLPTQYSLQYLKVKSNHHFIAVYSSGNSVEVNIIDSAGVVATTHQEPNMVSDCSAILDDSGHVFLVGKIIFNNSANIIKFDDSLNIIWRKTNANWASDPLLDYSVNRLYVLFPGSPVILVCFDHSGNVDWQRSTNVLGYGSASLHCDKFGNAYVGIDTFTITTHCVTLQQYDSTGNLIVNRTNTGYQQHFSDVNLSGRYFIAYDADEPHMHGYQLFGCDSSLTDTFSIVYENFQSKNDNGLVIKKDFNGDLICVCQVTDTIQYPNTYGYTNCIEVIKYDINGNLIWRTRMHVSNAPSVNEVYIDHSNNIYVCGNADTLLNDVAAYALEMNSSGQELWKYFLFDPAHPGNNYGITITTDSSLNVYFGGIWDTTNVDQNGFIAKLDQSGNNQWVKYFSPNPNTGEAIFSIVYRNNHIFALQDIYSASSTEFYIDDLDTAGTLLRQISYNHGQEAFIDKMMIDDNNNFYCYGFCSNPVNSWYLVKFDSAGFYLGEWRDSINGNFIYPPNDAVFDSEGNFYMTGFAGTGTQLIYTTGGFDQHCNLIWIDTVSNKLGSHIDFSNGIIYATATGSATDSGYVVAYDTSGTILFKTNFPFNQGHFYNYDIIADTNAFYILGTTYSDSTANDILLRKYSFISLGADEILSLEGEQVFPNPSSNSFKIIITNKGCDQLIVYNSFGEVIQRMNINRNDHSREINLELMAGGIYYYVLLSDNKKILSGKLIKL